MRGRGFTLIELLVAMAVSMLVVGLAVPAIASVTRAALRQKSGQLASGIRALYGATALGGHSCRMVFDLDAQAYWSECAKGRVRLSREAEVAHSGAREQTEDEKLLARAAEGGGSDRLSDTDRTRLELAQKSAFAPTNDVPRTELGGSVRFHDVWAQHQPERYLSGRAYLYFWPGGSSEAAAILVAQGDDVYTLLVAPLTGRVRVQSGAVDLPGEPQ